MSKHKELAISGAGLWAKFICFLTILLLAFSCSPSNKGEEERRGELQELKKAIKSLEERIDKLEAAQQVLLTLLKPTAPGPPPEAAVLPPPLSVSQLLAGKEQYLGARVTVKGEVGPILVHHKSLLLKCPQGMVEVFFGKLPDAKQVQRLTSTPINQPLTVTGVVSLPPGGGGAAKLQITAEAIDF